MFKNKIYILFIFLSLFSFYPKKIFPFYIGASLPIPLYYNNINIEEGKEREGFYYFKGLFFFPLDNWLIGGETSYHIYSFEEKKDNQLIEKSSLLALFLLVSAEYYFDNNKRGWFLSFGTGICETDYQEKTNQGYSIKFGGGYSYVLSSSSHHEDGIFQIGIEAQFFRNRFFSNNALKSFFIAPYLHIRGKLW